MAHTKLDSAETSCAMWALHDKICLLLPKWTGSLPSVLLVAKRRITSILPPSPLQIDSFFTFYMKIPTANLVHD